ncbi:MAG: hypothetical protein K5978_04515 [Campylobacter sp.]|nr:hypothetical protein [Campylobacter sp.]
MSEKQQQLRKQLLAKIHTHSRYKLLIANDAWQTFLQVRFGVPSISQSTLRKYLWFKGI